MNFQKTEKKNRFYIIVFIIILINIYIQNVNIIAVQAVEPVELQINMVNVLTGTAPFNTTGAGEGFHPGDDYSASDNYVRTLDSITYELHYSLNPAGGIATNTAITSTIPLNSEGKIVAVWEENLTTLYPGLILSDEGRTLTYSLGDVPAGNAYTFSPTAKVLTNAANGETFSVFASISAENGATQVTSPYTTTVSALPKVDLCKKMVQSFDATGPSNEPGKVYLFSLSLMIGDAKGGESIPGTITCIDDLSQFGLPNAQLYTYDGNPAVGVNDSGRSVGGFPVGSTTGSGYHESSITGTPSISATQDSPGSNINISISNLDQEGRYFPIKNNNSTPIPADKKYIFSGYIALWVAESDIPLGNTTVINSYTTLLLTGASGSLNYGGAPEPLENNTVNFNVFKTNEGQFSSTYLVYTKNVSQYSKLTVQTSLGSGDGVVYPGQTFGLYSIGGNGGTVPLNNYERIIKIDTTKLQITDLPSTPGIAHVLQGTDGLEELFDVQYGTGIYNSYEEQRTDVADGETWYSTTTDALASKTGPINKVRLVLKLGESLPTSVRNIDLGLNVTALNNPNHTVIPSVMAVRADEINSGSWLISAYDPENHTLDLGDRVFITEVQARIQKNTLPYGIMTAEANNDVTYILSPTLTTDSAYANITTRDQLTITDTLPKGLSYIPNTSNIEPTSVNQNLDGTTTIQWLLSDLTINEAITPITFKTHVDFDVKNATILENKVVISSQLDSSHLDFKTSFYGLNIVNLSSWGIDKTTPYPIIQVGDDLEYTLQYSVFKDQIFHNFEFIDILPYNGDSRTPSSDFQGSYTIKELSGNNGETYFFTTEPQNSINSDPSLNTNTWIPYSIETAKGQNITAIKIHANNLTSIDGTKKIKVILTPTNNISGDVYANRFSGRVSDIDALVYSKDVPITVVSSSIGDYVWNDTNKNGLKDLNEVGIPNIKVYLLDRHDHIVGTTLTDKSGIYYFSCLLSGNYQVKIDSNSLPKNAVQTFDPDSTLDHSAEIQLNINSSIHHMNFGYFVNVESNIINHQELDSNNVLTPQLNIKPESADSHIVTVNDDQIMRLNSLPKTGETNSLSYYILGFLTFLFGICLFFCKVKKNKEQFKKNTTVLLILISIIIVFSPKLTDAYYLNVQKKIITQTKRSVFINERYPASMTRNLSAKYTLRIDKINLYQPILQNATSENLKISVASVNMDVSPGQTGNYAIAGHRSLTYGRNFNRLDELEQGDTMEVFDGMNNYIYTVSEKFIVNPDDTWVLDGNENISEITLITCTPMKNPTGRLIIKGTLK